MPHPGRELVSLPVPRVRMTSTLPANRQAFFESVPKASPLRQRQVSSIPVARAVGRPCDAPDPRINPSGHSILQGCLFQGGSGNLHRPHCLFSNPVAHDREVLMPEYHGAISTLWHGLTTRRDRRTEWHVASRQRPERVAGSPDDHVNPTGKIIHLEVRDSIALKAVHLPVRILARVTGHRVRLPQSVGRQLVPMMVTQLSRGRHRRHGEKQHGRRAADGQKPHFDLHWVSGKSAE